MDMASAVVAGYEFVATNVHMVPPSSGLKAKTLCGLPSRRQGIWIGSYRDLITCPSCMEHLAIADEQAARKWHWRSPLYRG